jgi:hypothetical protein
LWENVAAFQRVTNHFRENPLHYHPWCSSEGRNFDTTRKNRRTVRTLGLTL